MPDRTPSPGLYEYKKVIEPITTTAVDIQKGIINLLSRYDFANLDRFNLVYKVMEDDVILQTGFMAVPSIEARANKDITLPYDLSAIKVKPGAHYYVNISYQLEKIQAMLLAVMNLLLLNLNYPYIKKVSW